MELEGLTKSRFRVFLKRVNMIIKVEWYAID